MKTTKKALFSSVVALVLCFSMFIGTTVAWFTDSVTSGVNQILAGNLDIEVEYSTDGSTWTNLQGANSLFSSSRWEPGHTEVVYLKVTNAGTLGLNYKVLVTPVSENGGVNVNNQSFKLSDYLVFGTTDPARTLTTYTRETARTAAGTTTGLADVNNLTKTGTMVGKTATATDVQYLALVVYMPESVGNEANYKTGTAAPSIELGIKVVATQLTAENDSFGDDYDEGANVDPDYSASAIPNYFYAPQVNLSGMMILNQDGTENSTEGAQAATGADNAVTHYTITSGSTVPGTTTPDATLTVPKEAIAWAVGEDGKGVAQVQFNVTPDTSYNPSTSGISIATDEGTKTMEIKVTGLKGDNAVVVTTDVFYRKNLTGVKLYHNANQMTQKASKADVTGADEFYYDASTGMVTLGFTNCSPFTIVYKDDAVALIGDTIYGTLQSAVDAAQNGETIYLLKDVVLAETLSFAKEYNYSKSVTINMNGKSIVGDGVRAIHVKQGTLKLDGTGTVSSTVSNVANCVIRVGDNAATATAKLYVQPGVTVSTATSYGIVAFGAKNEYVYVYGTVTSTAPENAAYDGCAISTLGSDTTKAYIYIYDGASVSAANTNAIYMPSGYLYVYDGATVTGRTGIYVKSGTTYIYGGNITGNGPAKEYNYYGNGGISTGDALVVDSCGYPGGNPSVYVKGGTFNSVNAKAVASYNTEGNALVNGFITGGKFSSRPETENVKPGYVVDEPAAGYYAVITCQNHVNNAGYCDNCRYEFPFYGGTGTEQDPYLINNAHHLDSLATSYSGKYFKLVNDITVTVAKTRYLYNGTLDGDGHRITVKDNDENTLRYLFYQVNNSTIKNLEVDLDYSLIKNSDNVVLDNVDVYGGFNATGNEAAYLIYASNGATFTNCNSYATLYGNGDGGNYNAVFVGYPYGGTFTFTDCTNEGSLSCGKAAMFIANGSYDKVTLIINNCKNNGTIQAAYFTSNVSDYFPNYFRAITNDGKGGSLIDVTVDGVVYKGNDKSANALNGDSVEQILTGENGKFINGPMDATLALTRNADGTFTITPASAAGVVKYEISIGMYATIKFGGSCREFIQEVIEVTDGATSYTSTIKDLAFVDQKWVSEHSEAVEGTLNGYTIYTLNGTSYYYLLDADSNTVNGNPRPLSLFGVTAYDSNGKIVAAAALTE